MREIPAYVALKALPGSDRNFLVFAVVPPRSMLAAWRDAVRVAGYGFCALVGEEVSEDVYLQARALGACCLEEATCEK